MRNSHMEEERPELRAIVRFYNFLQSEGEVFLKVDLDLVEGGSDCFKGGCISGLPYCMGNTEEDCCHKFGSFFVIPSGESLPN